jgi:NADPH:quinone reductase-like Zn-dependent oxidoreductase
VNHATGDVKAAVQEATGGHGIDVVVENVGEATWATSLQVAAPGGRVTVCGATSGPNPPAALHRIWWKQLSILGSTMGTGEDFAAPTSSSRAAVRCRSSTRCCPLEEIRAAHERLEAASSSARSSSRSDPLREPRRLGRCTEVEGCRRKEAPCADSSCSRPPGRWRRCA